MPRLQRLRLRQVSESVGRFASLAGTPRPRGGWVRAIRTALGMSTTQLARRVGIGQSALAESEKREANDAITLGTLRRIADALDCDLVYGLAPRTGSLEAMRDRRAREIAVREVARVSQSMALEDQATSEDARRQEVEALTRELLEGSPRRLWGDG